MEKLNCEDLMVGDWVYNSSKEKCKVHAISNMFDSNIHLDNYDKPNDGCFELVFEVEPIPLTKELVLKCFEVNEHIMKLEKEKLGIDNPEWLYLTYKNEHFEWILSWGLSLYNEGFSLFIYDCPLPEIHYVHELQHFLKLCGSNKEIVL